MPGVNALKILIPVIFTVIIIGFIAKLGYDNQSLTDSNERLRTLNSELLSKNNDLAATIKNLADRVGEQNQIVAAETKRRAAAEMKQQGLQDEVKDALRESKPSVMLVPDDVVERLRQQADSVRNGSDTSSSDTSQPAK
ncbi:DUF2570 domain-containing protein [Erwinia sorbitola]|uniref:DUF2570 domain-containing protein n=1 Tax=Erwinia sorbitola TaxID=2681984 RepID=A0A6I6EPS8_9GAMM|nr:DUF2570 domain-containing protein [Erwinia sorbitola]QGU87069.1 DUF2570 domain-containing protein [Erwinia sorbitola]